MIDYDKPADFSASSMEELQAAFVQSGADFVTISNRREVLIALMDQRKADAVAQASVAKLSPMQLDALRVALDVKPADAVAVQVKP